MNPPSEARTLYLASQSPRRRQLLEQIGIVPTLLLPSPQDAALEPDPEALEAPLPGELPHDYVQRVTALKLDTAIARLHRRCAPAAPILCADTTVALGHCILGKPANATEASSMLHRLAGTTHEVLTAIALHTPDGQRLQALSTSRVWFMPLTAAQIAAYITSGEPFGKAGSYGIQGRAAAWVARIDGSYSGIMGLPLHETAHLLHQAGWPAP